MAKGLLREEGILLRRASRAEPVCTIRAKERVWNWMPRALHRGVQQVVGHKSDKRVCCCGRAPREPRAKHDENVLLGMSSEAQRK